MKLSGSPLCTEKMPFLGELPSPMTLSTFNFLFTFYLMGENDPFKNYHRQVDYVSLERCERGLPEVDPRDPLVNENDAARYVKCVEEGVKRGIIIIMRKSFLVHYVFDDGRVFGERIIPEGGNYWVLVFEDDLIKADLINKDGSPKQGRFLSIFEGQFPDVVVPMHSFVSII